MTTELPIDDLLASWKLHLRALGRSPLTLRNYQDAIEHFTRWLASENKPATLAEFTRGNVVRWLAWMGDPQGANLSGNSRLTHFRGVRVFGNWLVDEGELDVNPAAKIEQPRADQKAVPVFTPSELSALLASCKGKDLAARRDEALVRVFIDCGPRITECAGINVADVDLRVTEMIRLHGKGGRERYVPFGAKTGRAIDRYLRVRRDHRHKNLPELWLSQRGAMSADGIEDRLKVRATQAGVENVHAHRFRHDMANDWLANEGQGRDLMHLMGWSSEAMLAVYGASAAKERAQAAHRRMGRGDRV